VNHFVTFDAGLHVISTGDLLNKIMHMENSALIISYIDEIWNQRRFDKLDQFLHEEFSDHSLPPSFPQGKEGLKKWIEATSDAFEHQTIIEDQVTEGDKSIIRVSMELKHTGTWRNYPATGKTVRTKGFRSFRITDHKIVEHWAQIDGQMIETQIKD